MAHIQQQLTTLSDNELKEIRKIVENELNRRINENTKVDWTEEKKQVIITNPNIRQYKIHQIFSQYGFCHCVMDSGKATIKYTDEEDYQSAHMDREKIYQNIVNVIRN